MNFLKKLDKDKILRIKIVLAILFSITQIYFVVISILKPKGMIEHTWHPAIWIVITLLIFIIFGMNLFSIYKNMFKKIVNMDTLLGLAAHSLFIYSFINAMIHIQGGAYTYDVFWEGAGLLVIFSFIGRTLEMRLRNKSVDGHKELLKLKSKTVILFKNNKEIETPIDQIKVGDVIIVKAKSNVPLDGVIVKGSSSFDYSKITGESKFSKKTIKEEVVSGSVNMESKVFIKVSKTVEDSTLSVIIDKAEDLSLIKPKMQMFADKILKWFIPFVFLLALTAFLFWITMGYAGHIQMKWFKGSTIVDNALLAAVTVLAIACPCALGVATPLVVTVSSSLANKNSLLFSDPEAFEKIRDVKVVAFDKTGTLTTGKMKVVNFNGEEKYLKLAAAIESHSIHPIANAINEKFNNKIKITNVKEIPGVGIEAKYKNIKYMISKSNAIPKIEGATVISLKSNKKELATFEVMDDIKPNAKKTIDSLHKMGIKTVMITGDSDAAAQRVAKVLGMDFVYSEILPEQKAEIVKKLRRKFKLTKKQQTMFLGDGFNDILALKTADISIAFASGSDITNSLSDISILNDDLETLIHAIEISKWNQRKIIQSLTWAITFNLLALPIAFMMLVQPWIAAIIMLASDIAVVSNALFYKIRAEKHFKKNK